MQPDAKIGVLLKSKGHQVFSVGPRDTVYHAIATMAQNGIGALLVMESDRLLGILSERDYMRKVILQGRSSKEARVEEIMTSSVITTTPEQSVEDAMRMMTEHRIRHLPVVEGTRVVGVLSIGDLVKWIISAHEATINHLKHYISGGYMS